MRNKYSPWGELADLPHITIEWRQMIGKLGEYVHDRSVILLDPRMKRHQRRSVLCHELRHAIAGDEPVECEIAHRRRELRTDRAAARLLIDLHDLGDALALHDGHAGAVAQELDVALDVVWCRINALHPSERHYLARRLSED